MIAPLVEYVAWKRQQDYYPRTVRDRIKEKLCLGEYGELSNECLDELVDSELGDPHLGLRDKLRTDSDLKEQLKSKACCSNMR
jgi:hypothetical protein